MIIKIVENNAVKLVNKPWGWEKWIQPGNDQFPFVLKQLMLRAGNRTSLQVHKDKSESLMILSGKGQMLTHDDWFNSQKYLKGNYSSVELTSIINNLKVIDLKEGDVVHIQPGTIHRMIAIEDLLYVEASTTELDDVIRLQDDNNRQHGRIDSEHK